MKKLVSLLLILVAFQTAQAQLCPVFPHPTTYVTSGGNTYFDEVLTINTKDLPTFGEDDLKWFITHEAGINVLFVHEGGQLIFNRLFNVPKDAYSIDIKGKITISYSSEASCFYALQSLKQLIQKDDIGTFLPNCFISDNPKFEWRGMHLDVSRHFFTVEEVKKYLDWMARYKFNKFHWHLTDDQGWRVEIKAFPKLTEIGSLRKQTLVGLASVSPEKYDNTPEKGFYTQEEIQEVVAYAKKRFIEVVPEIEMPGHASAALAAYPEYSCTGETIQVAQTWGVFEDVFCSKDETIDFLQQVLAELIPLFPGQYFHVGGDEAPKTRWKVCPACQAQMGKHQLKDESALQSFFIQQMDHFLKSNGKTLIGWDEILEGGLSENAAVMSWRGTEGGIEAAKQHHYVVMTPGSHCYFDHYQSDRKSEPLAIGGFTSLEKVYSFNPIPADLEPNLRPYILGGQANLWTEYIANWKQVEYMILPRMIALSEVLWFSGEKEYESFRQRLEKFEFPYLESKKANYSKAIFYIESEITPEEEGVELEFEGEKSSSTLEVKFDQTNPAIVQEKNGKIRILRSKRPHLLRFTAKSKTTLGVDTLGIEILQHSTLGQSWIIENKLSQFYPGKGGMTLSDGIIGGRPWNGKEWLGFDQKEIKLSIELPSIRKIDGLNLSFLEAKSSWICLPETVVIDYSKNGTKWKSKSVAVSTEKQRISIKKKAKYLRITVVNADKIPDGQPGSGHAPWLFMDEIWLD
ncbi:MAG: beta-N-acetylhexosaminidase [Crocinitomicaceae bacterium]